MLRRFAAISALALSASAASAQPTATLPSGFTFVDWLTVNNATVGAGALDDRNVVYFLKEKQIGNLQSWLIFFDPGGTQAVIGTVSFQQAIANIFTSSADVNTTSAAYRLTPPVTYAGVANTGLEAGDAASFLGNNLSFDWNASDPGDHVRVLTTTVPEPSTYAMLFVGFGAISLAARRRRHNA
ncbi:MAG: PEP-CTERM sorting domain-containing protein [Phycisphaerae bacterium]|nr:PEP-CTERM sorting domain-containing protein [Gemmatimonadaceae bacterium]